MSDFFPKWEPPKKQKGQWNAASKLLLWGQSMQSRGMMKRKKGGQPLLTAKKHGI